MSNHVTTLSAHNNSAYKRPSDGWSGTLFGILIGSIVVFVLGFSTNAWSRGGINRYGLWEMCTCYQYQNTSGHLLGAQVLLTLGLIGLILSLITCILYLFVHTINKGQAILALVILLFLSLIFINAGFITYAQTVDLVKTFGFSFVFACIGSLGILVSGILVCIQLPKVGVVCVVQSRG